MSTEEVIAALHKMTREDLCQVADVMAGICARRGEEFYDLDPENNGREAQRYADAEMYLSNVPRVWSDLDDDETPIDEIDEEEDSDPTSAAPVETTPVSVKKDPWGGR